MARNDALSLMMFSNGAAERWSTVAASGVPLATILRTAFWVKAIEDRYREVNRVISSTYERVICHDVALNDRQYRCVEKAKKNKFHLTNSCHVQPSGGVDSGCTS